MRYFFTILATLLLLSSCEDSSEDVTSNESSSELQGDQYIGELTILGTTQEGITFYCDEVDGAMDILMPGVSFMPGLMPNLDMALVDNPLVSTSPDVYELSESQMVVIYDRLPLLNDVIQSISNVRIESEDEKITISFDCGISTSAIGDLTVTVLFEGTKAQ